MKSILDIDIKNKIILLRSSLNVSIKNNKITNDFKLKKSIPTIKYLIKNKCKIIICGHIGRPDKDKNKYSCKIIKTRLEKLIGKKIQFCNNFKEIKTKLNKGNILLLENLRFNKGEINNNKDFSKKLSQLAEIFVQDSYETIHRKHASIIGIPKFIPTYAGLLLNEEYNIIKNSLQKIKKPYTLILGGGKSDKLDIIKYNKNKIDNILIGGGNANRLIDSKKKINHKIILPVDFIYDKENKRRDIGKESIELFCKLLKKSKTIIWCGPMGVFENKKFENGTKKIAQFISKLKSIKIIGGGESSNAIIKYKLQNKMTHVSTGGGATLELLKNKIPPGINAIIKSQKN
ncbi:phosphoglycerate kinase [Candidatus Woesearchaeota archaeon]|jgi:3-phosphoglycerate kinase|nr:phosphoglycerate kinase [Candidatus Woesearchaeota archaeon]MBT4387449.1 phosphoglycerate kinase [Candidatus Woesearchaeota archaeon]MBT4595826.1 phosphoglycerate kinase [Candidatus Woesearchaeota archaeon]MBT5741325.1 phosphoglycerate kinase [Candidatus Woesearchaeota archaeon]MBT6505589.1 phosphoglycerate kinase [Candidatus Woesearchaeota archaeon]